jgi:uncharacterized protein (TIGR02246 family)
MTQPVSKEIRQAIEAANENFLALFGKGDAAGIANLYTGDGEILPPNSAALSGRPAIQAFWQGALNMGLKSATLNTVELSSAGDEVIEIGQYTLAVEGGQQVDAGKYLVVWKQEASQWKLYRDIWNTSQPAAS